MINPERPTPEGTPSFYFLPGFDLTRVQPRLSGGRPELQINAIRQDFPILHRRINGKPLIWLDNAATTQKPQKVIDTLSSYYSQYNSNIHRGAHTLSHLATHAYELSRRKAQGFIGASFPEEIIFVRGATEAINLVAESFGKIKVNAGEEIVLTTMEHHSNIVPWQKLAKEKGAKLKIAPINDRGEIILEEYERMITPCTRIIAITHISNVLGTVNPVKHMTDIAHKKGAYVLIDGAQSVPHTRVNVRELDADFYVFSGHKLYGPTGIGILYGKKALLEEMPPWQGGGGMIKNVTFEETTFNSLPEKFEAGTGSIADAIGLGSAIEYVQEISMDYIEQHEKILTVYAHEKLNRIPGVCIIGTSPSKTSVISFVMEGISPDDTANFLNREGIAVRSGHHCAQPTLRRYGLESSVRASIGLYNTYEEIDCFADSILRLSKYRTL